MNTRIGSKINLKVMKPSGEIVDYGEHRNHISQGWVTDFAFYTRADSTVMQFASLSSRRVFALSGTWQQSGTSISRVTGSDTIAATSQIFAFADGTYTGWRVSGSGTSCVVSISQTISASKLYSYDTASGATGYVQFKDNTALTKNYSNGVTTVSALSTVFSPATAAYNLYTIAAGDSITGAGYRAMTINLEPEIPIGIGDRIIIDKFIYTFEYPTGAPVAFSTSPISGLTGTGRTQRLRKTTVSDGDFPSRIFLLTDANKISIPNMLGPNDSVLTPASYTILETIVATGARNFAAPANNTTEGNFCFGTVGTGGTVKQILWGTPSEFFGVIEYDTPVTIDAGRVISVGLSTTFLQNPVIPTTY